LILEHGGKFYLTLILTTNFFFQIVNILVKHACVWYFDIDNQKKKKKKKKHSAYF